MKPQILKTPQKGKLFGAQANEGVCETLEWMKNVCDNLRGDDIFIEVDRTDQDAPVIKLKNPLDLMAGGGGGEGDVSITPTYDIDGNKINYDVDDTRLDPYAKAQVVAHVQEGSTLKKLYAPKGGVKFKKYGTTQATNEANEFELKSADDSNIVFTMNGTQISVGCYYL